MSRPGKPELYWQQMQQCELFSCFDEEQIRFWLRREGIQIRCFAAGDKIDLTAELGILLSGRARVVKSAGGADVVMSTLQPVQIAGAAGLFAGRADLPTTITALTRCRMLVFPQLALYEMMQERPELSQNYIRYLTERILFLNARIESFIAPSAKEKLLGYFRKHSIDSRVLLPGNRSVFAKSLGISRASLYRTLSELEQTGSIIRQGDKITIPSQDRL
ncbi:MAG: Crp/Fnr family transcriptional regulator [Bacillota bacterium]